MSTRTKIGINGFGRMGRLAFRAAYGRPEIEVVHVNELNGGSATAAHLLKFDSVHGQWPHEVIGDDGELRINGDAAIQFSEAVQPGEIDWGKSGARIVIESTGKFRTRPLLEPYLKRGIEKIVVAAPVKEGVLNLVMGVNDHLYRPEKHDIITAASCTTNCLAPVVKAIHESLGIKHGVITTLHDVTNTQTVVDVRVPLLNASLTDCVFEVNRPTTVAEVNAFLKAAAEGDLAGILGYEERPLVSVDFKDDPRSGIVDSLSTMVVNGTQVKILVWYDNEWGYANRLIDLVIKIAAFLPAK
jgi:glyceraldehyde 3-phosphate dehydrogenase